MNSFDSAKQCFWSKNANSTVTHLMLDDISDSNCYCTLPPLLEELDILLCPNWSSLPALPASLKTLTIFGAGFNGLPALPKGLQTLSIQSCWNLTELPDLPENLTTLSLTCISISKLPALPESLKKLAVWDCPKLIELPTLTEALEELSINGCDKLQTRPLRLSPLTHIRIENCPGLR